MQPQHPPIEVANATSAILVSLLQTLIDKNMLSNADVRALLRKAASDISPHEYTAPAHGVTGIILDDILPRFPEDGGD